MKKGLITAVALAALAATAVGAVHVTTPDAVVRLPAAVVQALS
jgi:hypothetical protein